MAQRVPSHRVRLTYGVESMGPADFYALVREKLGSAGLYDPTEKFATSPGEFWIDVDGQNNSQMVQIALHSIREVDVTSRISPLTGEERRIYTDE